MTHATNREQSTPNTPPANPLDTILTATPESATINREQWLARFAAAFAPVFAACTKLDDDEPATLPQSIRFSCGWTSTGRRSTRIGEHWGPGSSADGTHEIFVTPRISDAAHVGAIVVHELCHAALFPYQGHGPDFRHLALAIGLRGHMRATTASADLEGGIAQIIEAIGPYPHAELNAQSMVPPVPPQRNRQIKCHCPTCGYTVRAARGWLDLATPLCPMNHGAMVREDTGQRIVVDTERTSDTTDDRIPTRRTETMQVPRELRGIEREVEIRDERGHNVPEIAEPELLAAPFSDVAWYMRAAEALGGESFDVNDVQAFITYEATMHNPLADDVAHSIGNVIQREGYLQRSGRERVIAAPSRMRVVRAQRELLAADFVTWTDEHENALCVTEHGRTHDPDATPEATPEQHTEAVAVRSRRHAAAFAEAFETPPEPRDERDGPRSDDELAAAVPERSARFAALDFEDGASSPPLQSPPAPRNGRALEID